MRIVHRIFRHRLGQGSLCPICFLRTFRKSYAKKTLNERRQAKFAHAEQSRGDHRVENFLWDKLQASAEQTQVEIGSLQNDFLCGQRGAERFQIDRSEWIDQKIAT